MHVGAASVDITPASGLAMAGFAARTMPATGRHDALTVRALVVEDTALIVCDVLGLDAATTTRIRQCAPLPDENVVVTSTHTHGAPGAMPDRLGGSVCHRFIASLEAGCNTAIERALANARPCRLAIGNGTEPDVAKNRRHADGTVDTNLPVVRFISEADEQTVAILISHACHPVVLGADNRLYTADYPHFVREQLESALPGAIAFHLTGAAGDVNSGHAAIDSLSLAAQSSRSFAEARRIGRAVAEAAMATPLALSASDKIAVYTEEIELDFCRRESRSFRELAVDWQSKLDRATAVERTLLSIWIEWAERSASTPGDASPAPLACRIALLHWGDLAIATFPGEIFAAMAEEVRWRLDGPMVTIVAGYADDVPGYIPPAEEFAHGGYEIDEAHRFYGLPASFAPDSVARLLAGVERLARRSSALPPFIHTLGE